MYLASAPLPCICLTHCVSCPPLQIHTASLAEAQGDVQEYPGEAQLNTGIRLCYVCTALHPGVCDLQHARVSRLLLGRYHWGPPLLRFHWHLISERPACTPCQASCYCGTPMGHGNSLKSGLTCTGITAGSRLPPCPWRLVGVAQAELTKNIKKETTIFKMTDPDC